MESVNKHIDEAHITAEDSFFFNIKIHLGKKVMFPFTQSSVRPDFDLWKSEARHRGRKSPPDLSIVAFCCWVASTGATAPPVFHHDIFVMTQKRV